MNEVKKLMPNGVGQPTNGMLWNMFHELNGFPLMLHHLLRPKINDFMKNNGLRIETIRTKLAELQEEHFVIIEGQVQMQEPLLDDKGAPVNPNAQPMPKYKPGRTPEEFNLKVQELMQKTTIIA